VYVPAHVLWWVSGSSWELTRVRHIWERSTVHHDHIRQLVCTATQPSGMAGCDERPPRCGQCSLIWLPVDCWRCAGPPPPAFVQCVMDELEPGARRVQGEGWFARAVSRAPARVGLRHLAAAPPSCACTAAPTICPLHVTSYDVKHVIRLPFLSPTCRRRGGPGPVPSRRPGLQRCHRRAPPS
jgi:hypothetical protein